ncbi:Armadillo-like helical domain containing protein [Gracilaria domingensis]|nr:Armadillo-like helical domain containing protein [Gracilaria domingensis]
MDSAALEEDVKTVLLGIVRQASENARSTRDRVVTRSIHEIIQGIHNYRNNLLACLPYITELCSLAPNADNRVVMASHGILKDLCCTLKNFSEDEALVSHVACLIASLVFQDDAGREEFGAQLGPTILTQVMRKHLQSVTVQMSVVRALRNAVWNSEVNCEQMRNSKGLHVLFQLMTLHSNHHALLEEILACICNIVSLDSNTKEEILTTPWYLDELMSQWQSNIENSDVVNLIGLILVNLTSGESHLGRTGIKIVVQAYGKLQGLDTLCVSLKKAVSLQDESMIATLAKLTYFLGYAEEFRAIICQSSCLCHFLNALGPITGSTGTLLSILQAIESLLSGEDFAKKKFNDVNDLNGVLVIIGVMEKHKSDELVTETCCRILDNAADGQLYTADKLVRNRELLGKAVITAMADYPKNALIQEHACLLLIKITSTHASAGELLMRLGAKNVVDMAKHSHNSHPSISSLANHLLTLLAKRSSSREGRRMTDGPKNASSRLRSRSRTIDHSGRSRSRAERNRSPVNMLLSGRRALEAAQKKLAEEGSRGAEFTSAHSSDVAAVRPLVNSRRPERKKMNLEPVLE